MNMEETIRRRWEKFEPMRIRIMQEAYDCADRNEVEAYNSIKVMCSEVLRLAEEMILAEREKVAAWMIKKGYATGHGDSTEDLLQELDWQKQEPVARVCYGHFTLTQTNVGIGERGMQAYEEAKKRGWVCESEGARVEAS